MLLVFHPFVFDRDARQHWRSHLRLLMDYGLQPHIVPARQAEVITTAMLALLMKFLHNRSRNLEVPTARAGARALQTPLLSLAQQLFAQTLESSEIRREGDVSQLVLLFEPPAERPLSA
jgi:hypothetical protein